MGKEYWAAEHIKIGHTYTRAEWVAGEEESEEGGVGYKFSFSTGISISRHHSSFAQHTSLPGHIDSSWLAETNQMVKWVSKGGRKKSISLAPLFYSTPSILFPFLVQWKINLPCMASWKKLQMLCTHKGSAWVPLPQLDLRYFFLLPFASLTCREKKKTPNQADLKYEQMEIHMD